ncbi:hypothetical protein TKK_0002755 [Trichogramma kaykai]
MDTPVTDIQISVMTSSAPYVSPVYSEPVTVSSSTSQLMLYSTTATTQSVASGPTPTLPQAPPPQPSLDMTSLLMARLDRFEANLDARDSHLISHINERFNEFTAAH